MTEVNTETPTTLHPLHGELSLLDEAVVRYHAKREDFIALLDHHLNFRRPDERYVYSSPNHLVLAEVCEDEEGRYWKVNYVASRDKSIIDAVMDLAPYKLDRVAFSRYRHISKDSPDKIKFYKWNKLYGKQSSTTTSTTSTTTSSCSATSTSTEAAN